jgi:glycerol kinase
LKKYIGSIDQGTTSTRFVIFDQAGNVVAFDQKEHKQIFSRPGWVEHDPMEIWACTREVFNGALAKGGFNTSDLAAIGITNQRETAIVWEKSTGRPVYNAIVWQDTRTGELPPTEAGGFLVQ